MRVDYSRVPHPCATMHCCTVRLACLIHAASVRSEPGSNSPNNNFIRLTRLLMSDKFICAFFYFFRIHLCLKESSKPYSIESFASLSGQVRAIRTIQFFKEHQKQNFRSFLIFKPSPFNRQRVLNIAYFFVLSSSSLIFFSNFFSDHRFCLRSPEKRDRSLI